MSRWRAMVSGGLLSLAVLLGFTRTADAKAPAWLRIFRPKPTAKRASSCRDQAAADPLARRRIMTRQIGFEAQQQGYLAKVQGAASQNVLWITPRESPSEPSRKSWRAWWRQFFHLSD